MWDPNLENYPMWGAQPSPGQVHPVIADGEFAQDALRIRFMI